MRRLLTWATSTIGIVSLVEILAIEFDFGFPLLPEPASRVVLALAYSYCGGWVFYILVVLLPDVRNHWHWAHVVSRRLFYICNTIDGILTDIAHLANRGSIHTPEEIKQALDTIETRVDPDFEKEMFGHLKALIAQCLTLSAYIDAAVLSKVDRIDLLLLQASFAARVAGESLGQTHARTFCELLSCAEWIRARCRKDFKRISGTLSLPEGETNQ